MSNRLNDIRDRLVAVFSGINGSGSYTYDLSQPGRVLVGVAVAGSTPDVSLSLVQGDVEMEPGPTLTRYSYRVTWHVGATAPASADTPDARLTAANLMLADLILALTGHRHLNNGTRDLVRDAVLTFRAADGQSFGWAGHGVVAGEIVCEWESITLDGEGL